MEPAVAKPKFSELTAWEKTIRVLKVIVCVLSFGFIFPSISTD